MAKRNKEFSPAVKSHIAKITKLSEYDKSVTLSDFLYAAKAKNIV